MRHTAGLDDLLGEVSLLLHARDGDERDKDKSGGRDSDGGQKPKGGKPSRR
jgi:hypothetical protein